MRTSLVLRTVLAAVMTLCCAALSINAAIADEPIDALPLGALTSEAAAAGATLPADMARAVADVQTNLDFVWTMVAAGLVLLMQGGFLLLEAGLVRSKNSINVAQKNLADLILSGMVFGAVGFMFMFGQSLGGWFGFEAALFGFDQVPAWTFAFFVFQLTFCGTAATIVSGAVAERMRFSGYIAVTVMIAMIIYPVFGHWAWGNLLHADNPAFLADQGFIDFAGSTVVHSTGAWVALAAIIVLGPRLGRFDEDGKPVRFIGHNPVLASMGTIILLVGWIGFNGGSTTAGTPQFAHIVSNTIIAALAGGLVGLSLGRLLDYTLPADYGFIDERGLSGAPFTIIRLGWNHGYFRPERMTNGVLGGLVAITAGCDAVTSHGALAIGAIGAVVATSSAEMLERWFKLDDVVGAVPVHGFAGAWGTIAVAFFATPEALATDGRWSQFLIQSQGVVLNFVWVFTIAYTVLKVIDGLRLFGGLRVDRDGESEGLNVSEHGTRLGTGEVVRALRSLSERRMDMGHRLDETAGDESGELAFYFNRLMDGLVKDMVGGTQRLSQMSKKLERASHVLAEQSVVTADHAQSVSDTTVSVASSMVTMEGAVAGVRQKADSISQSASSIRHLVERAEKGVNAFAAGLSRVDANSQDAKKISSRALSEVETASRSIEELKGVTTNVEAVLDLVKSIADQTRLLALNARIEAARAGPAGKGFAVVAGEIKSLAAKTGAAVDEVARMIEQIDGSATNVEQVVRQVSDVIVSLQDGMSAITEAVEKQNVLTEEIDERFLKITEEASSVADHVATVSETSQDALSKSRVAQEGTDDVSKRILDVSANASASLAEARQLTSTTEEISSVVHQLEGIVGLRRSADEPDPDERTG